MSLLTKVTTASVNPCRMLDIHVQFVDSNITSLSKTVTCGIISSVARISQKGSLVQNPGFWQIPGTYF